ncbi:outer membrane receptor for ferric coprogen and ferric-rhodotorulic acid [Duganella sp. 1224]|uniref:TonB-dependent siderophore receptor n=1 Tax=Duganella sp. 1224 TaxID=2587052 RepID=UPI0017A359C1|nr:TonB-dependent siderophore receptor [Duganella sp. 1224]NYE60650.1 outer membrane receptor for ferric coprogen and ferric-rhodotorulic acid [Duganella sp. 1224]
MPRHLPLRPMLLALSMMYAGHAAAADDVPADQPEAQMQTITVTGAADHDSYTARATKSAGKLELSLRETPQSISVVSRALMDDFKLDNINQVLSTTTGVTVEKVETSRTYYTARGFDIVNFQYDGVGMPVVFGNVQGDLDTALYERIDVVRGANGLMASTGNPSATINFIRKRPTASTQASASLTLGSWNQRRVEGDVSTKLNDSGTVAGRAVLVHQQGDSYLDRYQPKKDVAYAVVDAHLNNDTVLTVGHSYETNRNKGPMWGALPLYYTDGTPTDYPVGTSTSANWSRWDTTNHTTFAELNHDLGQGWHVQGTLNYITDKSDSDLLYVYGTPVKGVGGGLYAYPSQYAADQKQTLADIAVDGKFTLGGRQHDLAFGYSWSRSRLDDISRYGQGIGTELPGQTAFDGSYPKPSFDASTDGSHYEDRRNTVYLAARFNPADDWKVLAGLNSTRARSSGMSYGTSKYKSASKTTPYVGVVYDISRELSAYASHTQIFNPQSETDASGMPLDPVEGKTTEAGLKAALFNNKLNVSGAVFKTRQNNTAEQAGVIGAKAYYRGVNAQSEGFEFDSSGELAKGWEASAGLTRLTSLKGDNGQAVRTYVPRTTLRVNTTYRLPALPQLKVGGTLAWQNAIWIDQGGGIRTTQASYATLGLMARYEIDKHLSLSVNLNNVTDKKYLTSLYWTQSLYAAPRNGSATLTWTY